MTKIDCDRVVLELERFLDGGLKGPEAAAVRSHLESCPDCRKELESLQELGHGTRALPRSIEPDRDLWPGIAAEIDQNRIVRGRFNHARPAMTRRLWLAAAAAAILVVSVTAAYFAGVERGRPRTAGAPPLESTYLRAAYGNLATDLQRTRDQLRVSLDQRQEELSPETWSVVMDNMAVIDNAIERIETALTENPEDGRLNRQLAVAYRRQIDLLQRATRLPAEV
jgi:hypothetical protein